MLNLFKNSSSSESIVCPNCSEEQQVPHRALSIFCKNCRTRIDIKTVKNAYLEKNTAPRQNPKTKPITCPYCHSMQDVLDTAISAYCKNCNQRITVKEDFQTELNKTISAVHQKDISCPHCGTHQKVPSTALSTFCPECGNRVNLQNYEIKGRFRGDLETKGLIYISTDGNVEGNINTGTIIVSGRFKGEVVAEEKVEIRPTGRIYGSIKAPALSTSLGAVFVGHLHIGK